MKALENANVDLVLPFVPEAGAGEVTAAFDRTLRARDLGQATREVSDLYFFETVVRLLERRLRTVTGLPAAPTCRSPRRGNMSKRCFGFELY